MFWREDEWPFIVFVGRIYLFFPNYDKESACAGSTRSSADIIMNGQSLPDTECGVKAFFREGRELLMC